MRKSGKFVMIALLALTLSLYLKQEPTFSQAPAPEAAKTSAVGQYQTAVVGSQNELFAASFLMDTTTGKTWRTLITVQKAGEWKEVEEPKDQAPEGSSLVGRYQIVTTYVTDTAKQDLGATVRVDTATGKVWYMVIEPKSWRWVLIKG